MQEAGSLPRQSPGLRKGVAEAVLIASYFITLNMNHRLGLGHVGKRESLGSSEKSDWSNQDPDISKK